MGSTPFEGRLVGCIDVSALQAFSVFLTLYPVVDTTGRGCVSPPGLGQLPALWAKRKSSPSGLNQDSSLRD